MQTRFYKIRPLAYCSLLSILVHLLLISSMRMFGSYDFSAPVNQPPAVMVDLAAPATAEAPAIPEEHEEDLPAAAAPAPATPDSEEDADDPAAALPEPARDEPKPPAVAPRHPEEHPLAPRSAAASRPLPVAPQQVATASQAPTMLKTVSASLAAKYEKLTYLVSIHGFPIGSAELEAKNENGMTAITMRMKSNAAISSFYPVDDEIVTRHIDGMFIMTNIRQQEGSFKSDESFTINVRKKSVSWVDFSRPRSLTMTVPTDDVLDTLSGIYYLRNRPLQVGKTETLNIFDSETYASVPVEILRREEMRLPNLTKVTTLVVRPVQKTAGIFRRTGDLLIWMTDDAFKVPVKIVTSMALGEVTAELISAETTPHVEAVQGPATARIKSERRDM